MDIGEKVTFEVFLIEGSMGILIGNALICILLCKRSGSMRYTDRARGQTLLGTHTSAEHDARIIAHLGRAPVGACPSRSYHSKAINRLPS